MNDTKLPDGIGLSPDALPAGDQPPEEWHQSHAGLRFNLHADRWPLDAHNTIGVDDVRALCGSPVLADSCIRTLAWYAENTSSSGLQNSLMPKVRSFLSFVQGKLRSDEIHAAVVASYRHFCRDRDGHENAMARIRPFLKRWHHLGYPGVSVELVDMISDWTFKSSEKNVAVNRLDPNEGPLMPDEHASWIALCLSALQKGVMSLEDIVCVRLLSVTGRRPEQVRQIKLKDMDDTRFEDAGDGQPPRRLLLLMVPRIKSKNSGFRTRFRGIPLAVDHWNLLVMQRRDVCSRLDEFFEKSGLSLQPNDRNAIRAEMPLIPNWMIINRFALELQEAVAQGRHGEAVNTLRALVTSDAWHSHSKAVLRALNRAILATQAVNREGGVLKLFPRRFRYTLEFDLERAGCTPPVIAWNLDHSTLANLASYSKNGPDRARELSKVSALALAPYVKMFLGEVVDSEVDAEGGDDPESSRILIDTKGGATCAVKRGCAMSSIPRCCYAGCPHFRPWLDGPHEQFLESLLEERERDLQTLRPVEDRAVIEAADNVIIGVVQVVRLCHMRKEELAAEYKERSARRRGTGK